MLDSQAAEINDLLGIVPLLIVPPNNSPEERLHAGWSFRRNFSRVIVPLQNICLDPCGSNLASLWRQVFPFVPVIESIAGPGNPFSLPLVNPNRFARHALHRVAFGADLDIARLRKHDRNTVLALSGLASMCREQLALEPAIH